LGLTRFTEAEDFPKKKKITQDAMQNAKAGQYDMGIAPT
jgi:hypothetical protein